MHRGAAAKVYHFVFTVIIHASPIFSFSLFFPFFLFSPFLPPLQSAARGESPPLSPRYATACSSSNKLITTSFAAANLERINDASTTFVSSQWTTFTSHITIIGKFSGFLFSLKEKLHGTPTPFDLDLTPGKPIFHPGHFSFKIQTGAYLTPAIQTGLPKSDLANFRPISNLNIFGKILKRLAISRFFPHISKSPSFSPLQSAYRKFHSAETALLKLTNDIMESIDSGEITIPTALEMSTAFDTLDHITLLHRLQHTFGLSGHAISCIRSYLADRSSFVEIYSSSSPSTTILTGVHQGSVLGPLLFVLFISPVANVINSDQSNQNNTVSFNQYADDTQLYIGSNSSSLTSQIASIESCAQRVHDWLLKNGLHLNPYKSEAIAFYNPRFKPLAALA